MTDESNAKARLMVLEQLNELINECADTTQPDLSITLAGVLMYDNGNCKQFMVGDLNRITLNGALFDLIQQIFFEAKNREINEQVEGIMQRVVLASTPGAGGEKAN